MVRDVVLLSIVAPDVTQLHAAVVGHVSNVSSQNGGLEVVGAVVGRLITFTSLRAESCGWWRQGMIQCKRAA